MEMDILIRTAEEKDSKAIYDIAIDPITRVNSFETKEFSFSDHEEWFKKKIKSENTRFYVFEHEGKVFAQVRFDKEIEAYIVGVGISKDYRGKGLGSRIVKMAIEKLKNEIGFFSIEAFIKKENIASIKSFENADFIYDSDVLIKGIEAIKMVFRKSE